MSLKSIPPAFSLLFFFHSFLNANPILNTEDHPEGLIVMSALIPDHKPDHAELKNLKQNEQQLVRIEKRIGRINKIYNSGSSNRPLGGISDPVDKWFWIWVIGWGLGLVLTLLFAGAITGAAIGIIWFLAFGIGSVALVLWLVKKFG